MNYLSANEFDLASESQSDAVTSRQALEARLLDLEQRHVAALDKPKEQAYFLLERAKIERQLERGDAAWQHARKAFKLYLEDQQWEQAIVCCDQMFLSGQPDALVALGHGLWMSITFPVDLSLTIYQLRHVVNDTPDDSDGAAVAAAMAAYVAELRGNHGNNDDITLVVGQLMNEVARQHGNVNDKQEFDQWFARLELDQPAKLFVRMRNIIDVLVQDDWWLDRDALQAMIPDD